LKQQERICCNCLTIMRIFWIFLAILAFTTGEVIKLQGTVEEENMRCTFSMVVKKMKVNVQRSEVTCSNPSRKIKVDDYTIGNEEVEFTLTFKVAKSGKGKIQKASIEIKDEEGLPNYISPLGLPSDWGNGSEVKDLRGNESTPAKRIYHGYTCNTNGWDADQWCLCKPGQKVSSMRSWHDNGREDRRWEMKCEDIKPEFKVTSSRWFHTTSANAWDGHVKWEGWWDDSFLVGMTSVHDNHREDRQFKFMTTRSDYWDVTNDCWGWRKINHYDQYLNLQTHGDEVIVGLQSWHSNHREDREWWAVVCKLKPKLKPTCKDDDRYAKYCPGWATWACVGQYESFMRSYCPKSCKFCT